MTRAHRKLHVLIWLLLAVAIGLALALAIALRDPAHALAVLPTSGAGP